MKNSFAGPAWALLAAVAAALLSGCQTTTAPGTPSPGATSAPQASVAVVPGFEQTSFSSLPPSEDADWERARSAFRRSCSSKSFATSALWQAACQEAAGTDPARNFFERNFTPWTVTADQSVDGTKISSEETGLMTGYYEPVLRASATKSSAYAWPVLATPPDLIDVELSSLYPELKGKRIRGKLSGRKLLPYDDRRVIDQRTDLHPYAIAWLADPIDQLFLQIQGSGKLDIPGRGVIRVSYADQNGRPYKAVANWLIARGDMTRSEASMQAIRNWAKSHPAEVPELLAYNPSYVFFKDMGPAPAGTGPNGAQGVPLTPGASVAVDRTRWKYGTPFFVDVSQALPAMRFSRPVVAQDTGGAIRGVIRFDYFWGSGDAAGESAGRQKSNVRAWVLTPRNHSPEELLK